MQAPHWFARVDLQPPKKSLHVQGTVEAPTLGHVATLKPNPHGNRQILRMDLELKKLPGNWPKVASQVPVVYVDGQYDGEHRHVSILKDGQPIAMVDIKAAQ